MTWTAEEAKDLSRRILSVSKVDECEATLIEEESSHTRFAANDVTTSGTSRGVAVTITSREAGRSGTVTTNETDPEALKRAVARSEELMSVALVDPESVEAIGPQHYESIAAAWSDDTAKAGAAERAAGVRAALEAGRSKSLESSGFFETEIAATAIANKKGLFGFHRATRASWSATMRTADGTGAGWAGFASPRFAEVRAQDLVARAAAKASSAASPRALDPGRYTVILEPQAVADLLSGLGSALSARAADEGRSYFSKPGGGNRIGEAIFPESISLASEPFDERIPARPWPAVGGFGGGGGGFGGAGTVWGLPLRRVPWIEKGVLKNLSVDRYWAKKTSQEPIPYSGSLVLAGGSGTVDDLIASTDRGLLVTRFWYIRTVNPQTLQVTGLTRDGVWLVEKGKIVGPVNNFRFNESPANLLKHAEAMSAAVSTGTVVVPAIKAKDFNFSSTSDAI
jgi:predicted Zn-dependent protease